jgi:IS30 family transposase
VTGGIPGSSYQPGREVEYRLRKWAQGCRLGWSTTEIAQDLGIKVKTLQRCVQRARAHGHELAVVHPNATRYAEGAGYSHIVNNQARRRVARRKQRAVG